MPLTTPLRQQETKVSLLTKHDATWAREIAEHLFAEFNDEFLTLSHHHNVDSLFEHYINDVAVEHSKLPVALVLHNDDEWLGVAILDETDMGMKPELGPWLTFFYIHPRCRGKGQAQILLEAVNSFASQFTKSLYLWCFTQSLVDFYKKRAGFELYEKVQQHGNRHNLFVLKRSYK